MVANDGHRLALIERDVRVDGVSNEWRLLVQRKAMSELEKLLSERADDALVEIAKDDTCLFFSLGPPSS
jgi:hypothetical protein